MQPVNPKKSLGQHFLVDKNIAKKIIESIETGNFKTLIEIGPGTGILTDFLVDRFENYKAVEIDKESYDFLCENYPVQKNRFILTDFLKFNLNKEKAPIALIGNLPYYISSQILFKVLEGRNVVNQIVCMVQKEVAERISSPPGSKKYGILSVLLQAYFSIEYLFTVHEHCFSPSPKVKSGVIRLKRNNTAELECDPDIFIKIVKATFNQRRKTIKNSLRSIFLTLPSESELLTERPEQLTVSQFVALTLLIQKLNH
ncbi:MAG: 16S rRNA (adenine(1518)-N(6)/adenine(1519)-N(6))-dimethyltransferase RsmA [Bacteroidales bacterium]|nr:16S rRNA (adenine(1518)-N(6)/adenine(1519)-N(6))-dimethyltransferase RsmA [Bacteroidales bacterium]